MKNLPKLSIPEIERKLQKNCFPFTGITPLGSAEFHFNSPSYYAGVAMHTGHLVRESLINVMQVTGKERFREEDPITEKFIENFPIQVIARDSRFEYDLNREVHRSIYDYDKKIWGINVWKKELDNKERELSLRKHKEFHYLMDVVVTYLLSQNRYAALFDMHSYCYQRKGRVDWYKDPNPEINIGSSSVNRAVFGRTIKDFIESLSNIRIDGFPVRVAENDVFSGGYLARRLNRAFPDRMLVLALEYKKIFMDEVSGELFDERLKVLVEGFNQAAGKLVRSGLFSSG